MILPAPSGTSTELSFTDISDEISNCGVTLDNIAVTPPKSTNYVIPAPEFPGIALPAALIVGLIGAVLFVQKSKED
jgi:hypothetical protein